MIASHELSVLQFAPIYQERVWGGRNLERLYGRKLPSEATPYGESWEICDRAEAQSVIAAGPLQGWSLQDLWTRARNEVFGFAYAEHPSPRFPLLIKILDAQEDLSMQVHPDDESATSVGGEAKSEAWYVTATAPGAKLYAGMRPGTTPETFRQSMGEGSVAEHALSLQVAPGDCLAVPGGTLHAIGAGVVIFEIQQNSDTTYRVFDWNRVGLDGKPRALHQEEAMKVLHFDAAPPTLLRPQGSRLLDWPYFKIDRWELTKFEGRSVPRQSRFKIGAVVEGEISWRNGPELKTGDFFLVPACLSDQGRQFKCTSVRATLLWISL
ncbi:type I phosphomannose isomerase catalytic subunit [Verrucomicrobium sp. BvORR106]|uniref:type I phosphomannose isomerase catalytic subunit n=1 Tax=Verrucomicrobium sp. BvORR106 TaxID=1403819 RepID=UPI0005720AB2|nr:type I phosphomannose isomerase catalytic subunit [Verrucomicrobium sp. BvORR106]